MSGCETKKLDCLRPLGMALSFYGVKDRWCAECQRVSEVVMDAAHKSETFDAFVSSLRGDATIGDMLVVHMMKITGSDLRMFYHIVRKYNDPVNCN